MENRLPHSPSRFPGWSLRDTPRRLVLLLFLLIVFGPLAALVIHSLVSLQIGDWRGLALALPGGRRLGLLARSLGLASSVAAAAMILSILAGSFLWQWHRGARAWLRWCVLLAAVIPPYVQALAWMEVSHTVNGVLDALGLPGLSPPGWTFSGWVQFMALSPIAVGLTLLGLESIDHSLIEAARVMQPDGRAFLKVILPMAAPLVLAGGGFVFLLSLTDYSIPSLFHLSVYPLEIFAEYSASAEPWRAFLLAVPLLLITVGVLSLSQARLRSAVSKPLGKRGGEWRSPPCWPSWLIWLQRPAVFLLALQLLVPLAALTMAVGTWGAVMGSVSSARGEIAVSLWIAAAVVVGCLPLALCTGGELLGSGWRGRTWWFLVTVPLAVPAPLVGVGLIVMWNQPSLPWVYGSDLMPILASLARFTPLASIALLAQMRRIDPLLLDAGRVFQRGEVKAWIQVRLPMAAPGFLAAAAVALALTLGELGATLIVAPPGRATVTMRIYNYLHYGASETVAGLCLMMTGVAGVSGGVAMVGLGCWGRLLPGVGRRSG